MADKYNKLEPKVPKEVKYALLGFVALLIALFFIIKPTNQEKVYSAFAFVTTSSDFTEDHPFYEVSYKKLMKKIESEDYVFVLIGSPESEETAAYIGAYQKYFENENVDDYVDYIYYYNPTDEEDNLTTLSEDYEMVEYLNNQLVLFIDGEAVVAFEANGTTDEQLMNRATRDFFEDAIAAIKEAE